jgi:hypothetical protein
MEILFFLFTLVTVVCALAAKATVKQQITVNNFFILSV